MKKLLNFTLKFPAIVFATVLIITALFFVANKKWGYMETDLNKYMPEKNPAFVYSNKAEEWFNIKDAVVIAIEDKTGIYNSRVFNRIKSLTKELQKMKEIKRDDVTSLYTVDNIVGVNGSIEVKSFYDKVPKDKKIYDTIKKNIRNNDMVFGKLVSYDETVSVIVAEIEDGVFTEQFFDKILALKDKYSDNQIQIHIAGKPIVQGTMAIYAKKDMRKMLPIVSLLIFLLLLFIFRSFKNTFLTLFVVIFSVFWAFGLMAVLRIPIYAISTMMPVMLIAIGVAYGIHMYNHLKLYLLKNPDAPKKDAIRDMFDEMWKPVVMTAVTTAIGFISLVTSQVYPIKYFGIFTAVGVITAMLLSIYFIPASIMLFGLPRVKSKKTVDNESYYNTEKTSLYTKYVHGLIKHKRAVYISTIIVIIFFLFGISKVWVNSSFIDKFDKNSPIVKTDAFINKHFSGTSGLNVILESKKKDTFKNPEILKKVDELQTELEKDKIVGATFSITDFLKRMNKVMHDDNEKFNRIPDNYNLLSQYILLYEMSGDPENLMKVADYNYKKININIKLKSDNSKAYRTVINIVNKYKDYFVKKNITVNFAGSGYKSLVFMNLIFYGQLISLAMAIVLVVILLSLMFKSVAVGLIGSIPVLIAIIINFGMMGILNIPLDSTTALLSSIAIGIGIDYAIHLIQRYKIYAEQGYSKMEVLEMTMAHSGKAVMLNTLVVFGGFIVLVFSNFPRTRALGALVSLNMVTTLLGTITIMLVIMHSTNLFSGKNKLKK